MYGTVVRNSLPVTVAAAVRVQFVHSLDGYRTTVSSVIYWQTERFSLQKLL